MPQSPGEVDAEDLKPLDAEALSPLDAEALPPVDADRSATQEAAAAGAEPLPDARDDGDAGPPPGESVARPPLLASEALMEDLAPMEPARGAARFWCAAIGLAYLLLGGLSLAGLRPGGYGAGASAFALGAVALVAALTRIPYRQRAAAMVAIGALSTVLGLGGSGPALGIDAGGGPGWGAARALAAAALPAALVFRARYRAYAGARWLLVAAFAATLPFVGHTIARLVLGEPGLDQVGSVAVLIAVASSLIGFMGAETTSAGTYLAAAVVLALTGDLALAGLAPLDPVSLGDAAAVLASATAFAATSAFTCVGLFQILAWRLAADARRIDLHPPPKESRRRASSGDWLT